MAVAFGVHLDPDGPQPAPGNLTFVEQGVVAGQDVLFLDRTGVVAGLPAEHGGGAGHEPVHRGLGQADRVAAVHEASAVGAERAVPVDRGQVLGQPHELGGTGDGVAHVVGAAFADGPDRIVGRLQWRRVPPDRHPLHPGVQVDVRVDLAEVVVVAGLSVGVAHTQHGAPLVLDDHGPVVQADRPHAQQGQPACRPVGSAGQVLQSQDPDGGVECLAVADGALEHHPPVEEVGDDPPGGDGALADRHVHDQCGVDQRAGSARDGLGERSAEAGGERVAAHGLVDRRLPGADGGGRCSLEHLAHRQVVHVWAGIVGSRRHRVVHVSEHASSQLTAPSQTSPAQSPPGPRPLGRLHVATG